MKPLFIIAFLCCVITKIIAQKPVVVEASSFSMAIKEGFIRPNADTGQQFLIIKKNIVCDVDYEFAKGSKIQFEAGIRKVAGTVYAYSVRRIED